MDRSALEVLLGQDLSLAEIGRRFGRHESTIAYWIEKFGLEAANRNQHLAKGPLTQEKLQPHVDAGMTIAEIAESVGRGKASVRHWLKKHRLSTAPAEQRRRRREARDAESSTVLERCHRHGLTEHYLDSSGHYRCKRCRTDAVIRRRRKVKQMLVIESGSRCRICG